MRPRPLRWLVPLAAASMLVQGCGDDGEDAVDPTLAATTTTTTTTVAPTTTVPQPSTTALLPVDAAVSPEWDSIARMPKAKAAPPAATCPDGTDPNAPGPVGQARPGEGPWSNQAAIFDTHQGRTAYRDEADEAWTFDASTNTWQQMIPDGFPFDAWTGPEDRLVGELVYDIDSDRTISFRYATSGDTASTFGGRGICSLDPAPLGWDCNVPSQDTPMSTAVVHDPISTGIVVINDGCCTWPGSSVSDDVWAIDMDTGEQIELLATANTRTETDGS